MPLSDPDRALSGPILAANGARRLFDIVVSVLLLVMIWPSLVLIGLAVALTSPGPVFVVQTRVGQGGRTFGMIRFRSMYRDARARRAEVQALGDREAVCGTFRADPRLTPVGRVLRRWSADELPQLFNVLKGDMSLVGPRPALLEEVGGCAEPAHVRHRPKPGITGL